MTPRELFSRYAGHQTDFDQPGFKREVFPEFLRLTPVEPGLEGFIQLAKLTEETADAAIEQQKAYFKSLGFGFEWKHHDFDTPADLPARLLRHGFKPDDTEALMIYTVGNHSPWTGTLPDGVRIERIDSVDRIRDVVDANNRANDVPWPPLARSLERAFDVTAIFCAYDGSEPVGTGWVEFPEGSEFAEIHGAAVVPSHRGKGIYSALFEARVQETARRGWPFIVVDAGPMSRPILLRKGFQFICETTPFRLGA